MKPEIALNPFLNTLDKELNAFLIELNKDKTPLKSLLIIAIDLFIDLLYDDVYTFSGTNFRLTNGVSIILLSKFPSGDLCHINFFSSMVAPVA